MFRCGAFGCLERAVGVCLRGRGNRTPDAQSRLIRLEALRWGPSTVNAWKASPHGSNTWVLASEPSCLSPSELTHPCPSRGAVHCAVVSKEVTAWSDMISLGTQSGGIFTGHTIRH